MSTDATTWSHTKVIKFINLLRSYPMLWDPDNPQFRNQFQRELAYDEISFAMNTTNDGVRKKIHTMRSQYLLEYKKLKSKRHYKPCWQYFDEFKFIYKHENINFETPVTLDDYKKPSSNLNDDNSNTQTSQDSDTEDNNLESKTFETNTGNEDNEDSEDNNLVDHLPRKRRHLSDESELDANFESVSNKRAKMEANSNPPQIQDEFTIFGENIANELRLLRSHQIIHNTLKSKIIRAIKEAKYAVCKARFNK